ncbi:MAG TPA: DUF547 domain-containing protein [Solimonas sp.]|nr:DUF547 domain-containing protein [Solimonas sp.]
MKTIPQLIALASLALAGNVQAAPKAELWTRWAAHDEASTQLVDHSAWDALLQKYVKASGDGIARLAYGALGAADRPALDAYLQRLQAVAVTGLSRAEQRAYWINLYNATTVKAVVDHYPVASIMKIGISPGLFTRGPWGAKLVRVQGEGLSLDDIEHRILRPIWKDPRTHYSVNCASLGCPNLAPHAWTAATAEEMLNQAARAFVNHPRGARVEGGKLYVSSIYQWFKADFGGDDAGVIAHLRQYAAPGLNQQLAGIRSIAGDDYDWSLNDAR